MYSPAPSSQISSSARIAGTIGCAVALANIKIIEEEGFVEQAAEKGSHLLVTLNKVFAKHPYVGNIRGKGMMCGVEFVEDPATKQPFSTEKQIGNRIHAATQQRGLFTRVRGDTFCLAPPIITSFEELDWAVDTLRQSANEVLGL